VVVRANFAAEMRERAAPMSGNMELNARNSTDLLRNLVANRVE
jgi:hypothetical protein